MYIVYIEFIEYVDTNVQRNPARQDGHDLWCILARCIADLNLVYLDLT